MTFLTVERKGTYLRVANPQWRHPLDGNFSKTRGGRWNAANSFPVVYLCADIAVAKANVVRKLEGRPYGVEDLNPREAPVLVHTTVATNKFIDVLTDDGCRAAGLLATYPTDDEGQEIAWPTCQPIGQRAWDEAYMGIVCRSTPTRGVGEELAWYQRDQVLQVDRVLDFERWFWE